jgi:hypothetical protein
MKGVERETAFLLKVAVYFADLNRDQLMPE